MKYLTMLNYTPMANIGRFNMSDFIKECENTILKVQDLLKRNEDMNKNFIKSIS